MDQRKGLVPPSLASSPEVILSPGREENLAVISSVAVREGEGKRGRATDDSTSGSILGAVAGAHELVVGSRPRDNASKVRAHGVKAIRLKSLVFLHNEVGGITLKALGKGAVQSRLGRKIFASDDIISKGILGRNTTGATSRTRGHEEGDVRDSKPTDGNRRRSDQDQVHEHTTVHVNVVFISGLGHVEGDSIGPGGQRGRGESSSRAEEGGGADGQELHLDFVLTKSALVR
mmetsp:Transcript_2302/g.6074  ORF Transcript_2302/g.6074 Transcript_2302/m.6074 type:complete len:232 (-) Transcript_2302:62-757(-)